MKAKGCCAIELYDNKGFTLPSNIGELGDDITQLDLRMCSLRGSCMPSSTQNRTEMRNFPRGSGALELLLEQKWFGELSSPGVLLEKGQT